jgi:hypothetical protein
VKAMPAILQVAPPSPRGSRRLPTWPDKPLVTCTNGLSTASAVTRRPGPFRHVPRGLASGGGKVEGNPGRRPTRIPRLSPAAWSHPDRRFGRVRQTRYSAAYLVRALWEREAAKGLSIVVASGTTRARTTTTGSGKWTIAAGSRTPADSRQHSSKRGYTHLVGQSPAAPVSWGIDLRTPRALVITIGVNVPLNNQLACAAASTAAFGCLTWPLFCTGAS